MALSAYTTIQRVRKAAGVDIKRESKQNLGTGDGNKTTFSVRYPKICSRDYAGSPASDDIFIYLDNSITPESSGNYTIDAENGDVIFNTAPGSGQKAEATYWHSTLSDDDIDELIAIADLVINRETSRSFYTVSDTKLQHTQYWDGNGRRKKFMFEKLALFAIQSISVDGVTSYVEDTDYYLYPTSAEAYWIEFEVSPSSDNKNIFITYDYGLALDDIVTRLSTNLAAQEAVNMEMARRGTSGSEVTTTKGGKIRGSTNRFINTLKMLQVKEKAYWALIGSRIHVRRIGRQK